MISKYCQYCGRRLRDDDYVEGCCKHCAKRIEEGEP